MPQKHTFEFIKSEFEARGYILLEKVYINASTKMRYRCPEHPERENYMEYRHLREGKRCRLCANKSASLLQKGESGHRWKGGLKGLRSHFSQILGDWRKRCLEEFDGRCVITGEKADDLEIHHTKPFYVIRDEVLKEMNLPVYDRIGKYSRKQLIEMDKRFLEKHKNVVGVPIRKNIHFLFHNIYGADTNFDELIEFKARYLSGEFSGKEIKYMQLSLVI